MINCNSYTFTRHAAMQMFERLISIEDVKKVLNYGEVIQKYPGDKPYPSFLILNTIDDRPLHVVVAQTAEDICIVITAYEPSIHIWDNDFRTKIK